MVVLQRNYRTPIGGGSMSAGAGYKGYSHELNAGTYELYVMRFTVDSESFSRVDLSDNAISTVEDGAFAELRAATSRYERQQSDARRRRRLP